jgi:hypothetical protein
MEEKSRRSTALHLSGLSLRARANFQVSLNRCMFGVTGRCSPLQLTLGAFCRQMQLLAEYSARR